MDISSLIILTTRKQGITLSELARRTGQSPSSLSQKLKANNFKISDIIKLLSAIDCTLELSVLLPDGKRINEKDL